MVYVRFKSVQKAKKYNRHATTARQAYANTHLSRIVTQIGRHQYINLYNTVTRETTRLYVGDVDAYWTR